MKAHTAIYFNYFGYDVNSFIECECGCRKRAVDINHIFCKGMGGSKKWDFIENLMAMARDCHQKKGDNKLYFDELVTKHALKMGINPEIIFTKLNQVKNSPKT